MEVITTHITADFDSLAAMLAAKKLYPNALIVFPGSLEDSLKEFLEADMFPYEITKLRDIDINDVELLIIVDCRDASRIGPFEQILYKPDITIHIYDHHPPPDTPIQADKEKIEIYGAVSTLMTRLLLNEGISISPVEATILAMGIYEDTGMLTFRSTTPDDLKIAAELLSLGADLRLLSLYVNREMTSQQVNILNDLIESAQMHVIQGHSVVIASTTVQDYKSDLASIVHKFREIEQMDVLVAIFLVENRIHIILRSRTDKVDVSIIAKKFNGGGHPTAASATVKKKTLPEVKQKILQVLHNEVFKPKRVVDIMNRPVTILSPDDSVLKAQQIMNRFRINYLCIADPGSLRFLGIISRPTVDRTIAHGLSNNSVSMYMSSESSRADPQMPLEQLQKIMIEENQKFMPVVEDNKLVGVVTRMDLMKNMYEQLTEKPRLLYEENQSHSQAYRKNVARLLSETLPKEIKATINDIRRTAEKNAFRVYLVGGFVRDLLLFKHNEDIDIVVEGDGIEFAKLLSARIKGRLVTHRKFMTAKVFYPNGFRVDIASTRLEYYEKPVALPFVEAGSLKQDLFRRDFTFNAMAIKLGGSDHGNIIDYFGGQKDLKDRIIRVIHSLSFIEDPTRIIRAARFAQRFDFKIGKQTQQFMQHAINIRTFDSLSGDRFRNELRLLLSDQNPIKGIKLLAQHNVLPAIHPKLTYDENVHEVLKAVEEVIHWYRLSFITEKIDTWILYLASLCHRFSSAEVQKLVKRLKLKKNDRECIAAIAEQTKTITQQLAKCGDMYNSEIYRILYKKPTELILYVMATTSNPKVRQRISLYLTILKQIKININGKDLMRLGLEPGPLYSKIFDEVKMARLDNKVSNRQQELELVHQLIEGWNN